MVYLAVSVSSEMFGSFQKGEAADLSSPFARAQDKIEQQVSELVEKTSVFFAPATSDAERLHLAPELDEECECIAGQLTMLHNQATGAAARAPLRTAGHMPGPGLLDTEARAAAGPCQQANLSLTQQHVWLDLTRTRVMVLKESLKATTYAKIQQRQQSTSKRGSDPGGRGGGGGGDGSGEHAGAQERAGFGGAVKGYVLDLDRTLSELKHKLLSGFRPSSAPTQPIVQ